MATLRGEEHDGGTVAAGREDATDLGNGDSGNFARQAGRGRNSEKQFVVFSAMEGLLEGRAGVDGEQSDIDFGGYPGFFAEVGKIGGEAVAEVDGGAGQTVAD